MHWRAKKHTACHYVTIFLLAAAACAALAILGRATALLVLLSAAV